MPGPPDLYRLLGVAPRASEAEIRRAYRRNAIWRHRRGVLELQDRLQQMEAARRLLTDPEQRSKYDCELALWEERRARMAMPKLDAVRREGRRRRNYLRKISRDAARIGSARSAQYAPWLSALVAEWEFERRPSPLRSALRVALVFGALLLALLAVSWLVR